MKNMKLASAIGTAALVWAIYKVGEIKGSLETGIKFAKDPTRGTEMKKVLDEAKKGLDAIDKGEKFTVKMTKDDFKVEVEEAEENVSEDETTDQPED